MTRVRAVVITLTCLIILVPLLVLSTAAAGLSPRHWSGIPLSAVQLPFLETHPSSAETRPPVMDDVTDALTAMEYSGWLAVIPGQDGLVYIETTRLSPSLLPQLGHRFGGETVGVVYSPLATPARADGPGNSSATETWWQRTDPPGTWVTLMFGFPWQLGTALLLTAIVWTFVLRRRRRRPARQPQPAGVS
jgi:hypothetical protein